MTPSATEYAGRRADALDARHATQPIEHVNELPERAHGPAPVEADVRLTVAETVPTTVTLRAASGPWFVTLPAKPMDSPTLSSYAPLLAAVPPPLTETPSRLLRPLTNSSSGGSLQSTNMAGVMSVPTSFSTVSR